MRLPRVAKRGTGPVVVLLAAVLMICLLAGGTVALAKRISGTGGADRITGTKGADRIAAGKGRDKVWGRPGPDTIKGGRGKDMLHGGRGHDRVIGGKGNDLIFGGPGNDEINMRDGVEIPSPGHDRINARDGRRDSINCGAGRDIVKVDSVEDGVFNCEIIKVPKEDRGG